MPRRRERKCLYREISRSAPAFLNGWTKAPGRSSRHSHFSAQPATSQRLDVFSLARDPTSIQARDRHQPGSNESGSCTWEVRSIRQSVGNCRPARHGAAHGE